MRIFLVTLSLLLAACAVTRLHEFRAADLSDREKSSISVWSTTREANLVLVDGRTISVSHIRFRQDSLFFLLRGLQDGEASGDSSTITAGPVTGSLPLSDVQRISQKVVEGETREAVILGSSLWLVAVVAAAVGFTYMWVKIIEAESD